MSYSIELGKRVLSLKTTDDRFSRNRETLIFLDRTACNNVWPRDFTWNVLAVDDFSSWGGEAQMPSRIWQMGYAADAGVIKPWNKDVSGIAYLKSWKKAVADRKPADEWRPTVTIWFGGKAEEINTGGAALFGDDRVSDESRDQMYAAFKRLFPEALEASGEFANAFATAVISTQADLLDAIYLLRNKDFCPFDVYVTDSAKQPFA